MSTATLTHKDPAAQFFYEHAGYSFDPVNELRECARHRNAQALADAERRMIAGPYYVETSPDPWPYDGDDNYDGPVWIVSLFRVDDRSEPECIGSIGGVAAEHDDPYMRVVAAELALEAIS
jgi:hypothetical protein